MTVVGASVHQNGAVTVTNQETWAIAARLPASKLAGGTGTWAFAAFGQLGYLRVLAGGTGQATAEVALGDSSGPFLDAFTRVSFIDAPLQTPLRAHPWMFVRTYDTVLAGARGTWDGSKDVCIWARIALNGDPPASVAGSFNLAGISIYAFRINALTTNQWFADRYTPASPEANNVEASGFFNFHGSSTFGVFDTVGKEWLVFASTQYQPGIAQGAPLFQTVILPTGSFASVTPVLGCDLRAGSFARGPGSNPNRTFYNQGGARVFTVANTAMQLGVRGYDWLATAGQTSRLWKWECFAIRVDKLGFFQHVTKDSATAGRVFTDQPTFPPGYEALSSTRPYVADLEVLANGAFLNDEITGQTRSHIPLLWCNAPGVYLATPELATYTHHYTEGSNGIVGAQHKGVRADLLELRASWFQNPLDGVGTGASYKVTDFTLAAWIWENNPNFTSYPAAVVGPDIVIVPGYEAVSTASLPDFSIVPDVRYEEELLHPRNTFEAATGELYTWPRFAAPRRRFMLRWSGMTAAQRNTLLADFRASRSWRWKPVGESTNVALILVGRPKSDDVGVLHVVSAEFVEITYTGP